MRQNTKDWIQYASAIAMLLSAIALAMWSFYAISEVHGTVLTYVGEAIAFTAAVYGIALYAKNEIKREMSKWTRTTDGQPTRMSDDEEGNGDHPTCS